MSDETILAAVAALYGDGEPVDAGACRWCGQPRYARGVFIDHPLGAPRCPGPSVTDLVTGEQNEGQ